MVAKLTEVWILPSNSLNLAKIHMVAKRFDFSKSIVTCLNLAKIHMVAKQFF